MILQGEMSQLWFGGACEEVLSPGLCGTIDSGDTETPTRLGILEIAVSSRSTKSLASSGSIEVSVGGIYFKWSTRSPEAGMHVCNRHGADTRAHNDGRYISSIKLLGKHII